MSASDVHACVRCASTTNLCMHGIVVHARVRCACMVYLCMRVPDVHLRHSYACLHNSHRSHTAITYPRNHAPPTVASLALVSFLVSFRPLPPKRRRTSLRVPLAAVADRSVAQLYPTQNTTSPGWHLSKCSDLYLGCLSCMTRKCKVWICT